MPSDKTPITRTDVNVISSEIKLLREVMENELRHLRNEVTENTAWRQAFMDEVGPWRQMNNRVTAVEYSTESINRSIKVIKAAVVTIAIWAVFEMGKMLFAYLQKGP